MRTRTAVLLVVGFAVLCIGGNGAKGARPSGGSIRPSAVNMCQITTTSYFADAFIRQDGGRFFARSGETLMALNPDCTTAWSVPLATQQYTTYFETAAAGNTVFLGTYNESDSALPTAYTVRDGQDGSLLFGGTRNAPDTYDGGIISSDGQYVVLLSNTNKEVGVNEDSKVSLYTRSGTLLWQGDYYSQHDLAISSAGNFVVANGEVYNRAGNVIFRVAQDPTFQFLLVSKCRCGSV